MGAAAVAGVPAATEVPPGPAAAGCEDADGADVGVDGADGAELPTAPPTPLAVVVTGATAVVTADATVSTGGGGGGGVTAVVTGAGGSVTAVVTGSGGGGGTATVAVATGVVTDRVGSGGSAPVAADAATAAATPRPPATLATATNVHFRTLTQRPSRPNGYGRCYSGMFPCLRRGRGSRFVSAVSSADTSTGRVRRGSITSSTYPRSAATYGFANRSL